MGYGSNVECSVTGSIIAGLLVGGLAFAWHAVPYGWLMKRIGRSWKTGALLSVLPFIGSVSAVMGTICPETSGIAFYGVFAFLATFFVNFTVFILFFSNILTIGGMPSNRGAAIVFISFFLSGPFIGPVVATVWAGMSWGLPELLGIRREDSKNPSTLRGKIIRAAFYGVALFIIIHFFTR
jgi:MFS family permease